MNGKIPLSFDIKRIGKAYYMAVLNMCIVSV